MKVLEGMATEVFLQGLDWTRGSLREDEPSQGKAGMVPREPLQSHPTPNVAIPSCCYVVPRPGWRTELMSWCCLPSRGAQSLSFAHPELGIELVKMPLPNLSFSHHLVCSPSNCVFPIFRLLLLYFCGSFKS